MREHGVEGEIVRAVELNIKPGVSSDEGEGDDWPTLRQRTLDADIFVLGTPIWLGHPWREDGLSDHRLLWPG